MKLKYLLILFLFIPLLRAQTTFQQRTSTAIQNSATYAKLIPNAKVTLCIYNAQLQCTQPTAIYSDPALSVLISYPFYADINGNYQYYAQPGTYVEQVCAPLGQCYTSQITLIAGGTGGGGGGGNPAGPTFACQFNNFGAFGGNSGCTFTPSNNTLSSVNFNAANATNALPRIDPRHPNFSNGVIASCPNSADPTGVLDSSCAIQAAMNYASAVYPPTTAGPFPQIYLSTGTYKVSTAIRMPSVYHLIGDGRNSTILMAGSPTQNILTVYSAPFYITPGINGFGIRGSIENLQFAAPSSMSGIPGQDFAASGGYTATAVEIEFVQGFDLSHLEWTNFGGRCLSLANPTEEIRSDHLQFNGCRLAISGFGQASSSWDDVYVSGPGQTANSYAFDANSINGLVFNQGWKPTVGSVTLNSAATTGVGDLTVVVTCPATNCLNDGINGTSSPITVGNWFKVTGLPSGLTAFNGVVMQATAVSGTPGSAFTITSSPVSPPALAPYGGLITGGLLQYDSAQHVWANWGGTLQTPAAFSTTSLTGATWQPSVFPTWNYGIIGSLAPSTEIKNFRLATTRYAHGIQISGASQGSATGFYCEGFSQTPVLNSCIQFGGYLPHTALTSALPGSATAPVTETVVSTQAFQNYANDPTQSTDIAANFAAMTIMCADYNPNQTGVPCAANPSVNTNQYEVSNITFSQDGAHFTNRNGAGSTAPSGTTWPIGSLIGFNRVAAGPFIGASYGTISDVHTASILPGTAVWDDECSDDSPMVCAEILVGIRFDKLIWFPIGYTGSAGYPFSASFNAPLDTPCGINSTNALGEQCIKYTTKGQIIINQPMGTSSSQGLVLPQVVNGYLMNAAAAQGAIPAPYTVNGTPTQPLGSISDLSTHSLLSTPPGAPGGVVGSAWFEDALINPAGTNVGLLGSSPGFSNPYGHRFATQDSWFDTGGQSTIENITSWAYTAGSPGTVTFQATNTLGPGTCVVISGLVTGSAFNTQPGSCVPLLNPFSTTQFSISLINPALQIPSSYPTSATESGTATAYHSAMRFGFEGGPGFTGTGVCTEVDFWNSTSYLPSWQNCQGPTGASATIVTGPTTAETHNGANVFNGSARFNGGIEGVNLGVVYNLITWSNKIGYTTGAGCSSNCWTTSGAPTITLDSTDFVDPNGGNTMTKVGLTGGSQYLQDVNGLSLSGGTSYAISYYACYGTNTSSGVFTTPFIGNINATGGGAGVNIVQCSNTTPVYTHVCAYGTPTSLLTNTAQIAFGTTMPAGGTASVYLSEASLAPSPVNGPCPGAWTTAATPLTYNAPGVQANQFLGSLTDTTQVAGFAQFSSAGVLSSSGIVISGTPSANQVLTATGPTAANWQTPAAFILYGPTGTALTGGHGVFAAGALTGGTLAVTLSGSSVYTSSSSYACFAQDTTTPANAVTLAYTSGTQFTLTGTGTDSVRYQCTGN